MQIKPSSQNPHGPATVGWHQAQLSAESKLDKNGNEYFAIEAVIISNICKGKKASGMLRDCYDIPHALIACGLLVDDATAKTLTDSQIDSMPAIDVLAGHFQGQQCWIRVTHRVWQDKSFANIAEYSRFAPPSSTQAPPASIYTPPKAPAFAVKALPTPPTPTMADIAPAPAEINENPSHTAEMLDILRKQAEAGNLAAVAQLKAMGHGDNTTTPADDCPF